MHNSLRRRRFTANAGLAAALLACVALLLYPPTLTSLYPDCPIHQYFGIDCPGCGATRALAALLRGHLLEAIRFNALFVVLLPAALGGAIQCYDRAIRPGSFRWPQPPPSTIYATLTASVIFTIARNIIR